MNIKFLSVVMLSLASFSLSHAMSEDPNKTLMSGIRFSEISLVKKGLENGANVNDLNIDEYNPGYMALHLAFQERDLGIIQMLLEAGADITIKEHRFKDRSCDAIELAAFLVGVYHSMRVQPECKKVLELLQDWQKKLNEKVKKEVGLHLPPVLADIVAGYVV